MKYLNNMIFEDLMDRFKWYPKPFTLSIFCKDKKSIDIFEREIDANKLNFNKSKTETVIKYKGIWQKIDIHLMDNRASFSRVACRANAIIFDSSFPYDTIIEILMPLVNIEPNYGCFPFQRGTLEKDLKGIRVLPNYEINLED